MKFDNLFLDGGMGSLLLERANAPIGSNLELLNLTRPELVREIHSEYVAAGSDIIYTNTFGANGYKLDKEQLKQALDAAIENARFAKPKYVALDIGPLGKIVGAGGITNLEAYEKFSEIICLAEDRVDIIVIETMTNIAELRMAALSAKANSQKPIFVSMSFDGNLRTFFGTSIAAFAVTMSALKVDAIGINCSLGPIEMLDSAKEIIKYTNLPIFIKPNAGMPKLENGNTSYNIDSRQFGAAMAEYKKLGITILGGCCGTNSEYIAELRKSAAKVKRGKRTNVNLRAVSSSVNAVVIDEMKIIGERINPTGKKRFKQALIENDLDYIVGQAVEQEEDGAHILDVNVGLNEIDEIAMMDKVVLRLQEISSLPMQIDSSDPQVIEKALFGYNGKAIINSVNGKRESLDTILPLAKKYGAAVVGLTLDEGGIPDSAEKRVEIAKNIIEECQRYGIDKSDIYIDTLCMSEASIKGSANVTLEALQKVKALGAGTVLGISNISFGMPNREDINARFLELAKDAGLDLCIINPKYKGLQGSKSAYEFLIGKEGAVDRYIENATHAIPSAATKKSELTLFKAIVTGQKEQCAAIAENLLKKIPPLELAEKYIIPALDEVGKLYESGKLFLPQLIASAECAKAAFYFISQSVVGGGADNSKRVVLATVKGDIHDIGKNIVKTVVANYGYRVIDLGKDVDYEKVLQAVRENYPCVLGLSALMTTTVNNMAKTIELVKAEFDIPILVGGAVLTESYAKSIGGIYCKDANDSVKKLKEIYSKRLTV